MCFDFTVGGTCGLASYCDVELDVCVCDKGWKQSLEMIYFPFTKERNQFNQSFVEPELPCSRNTNLLFSFFCMSLITSVCSLIFHLPLLKTHKRRKRQFPLLLCFVTFSIASGSRMYDLDKNYAEDSLYTLFQLSYLM
eukprot:snap_masked-scaffold_44-processed-gene-1.9-mRNA-1 protein AED:0.36 eAED:1.00 QI:0/0/0/1/1/1/2/0/137